MVYRLGQQDFARWIDAFQRLTSDLNACRVRRNSNERSGTLRWRIMGWNLDSRFPHDVFGSHNFVYASRGTSKYYPVTHHKLLLAVFLFGCRGPPRGRIWGPGGLAVCGWQFVVGAGIGALNRSFLEVTGLSNRDVFMNFLLLSPVNIFPSSEN